MNRRTGYYNPVISGMDLHSAIYTAGTNILLMPIIGKHIVPEKPFRITLKNHEDI
jgi:hypothetical protein